MNHRLQPDQSLSVSIPAAERWVDTGIDIFEQERYDFQASGTWVDWTIKSGPGGYTNCYMKLFNRWKRSPADPWFALMGTLNRSGDFLIGSSRQVTFEKTGRLFCYANDIKSFYWNNKGSITLTITRLS